MALMIGKDTPAKEVDDAQLAYQGIQLLIKAKKNDLAIMALEKLVEKYHDFALAHNDLGVLYFNQGDKDEALIHYKKAAESQPDNITIKKNLANFYHIEKNQFEEAMQIYLDILKVQPEDIETLLAIGDVCIAVERLSEAKSFYNRVLEIEPWNSKAWQVLQAIK
jgi:tetratricopeptide (TPR) repeat protein